MAATAAWLAALEALLNRGVQASAQASVVARRLAGTSLRLEIDGMAPIRICVIRERLVLSGAIEPVDATISGSPPALLRLAGATGPVGKPPRGTGAAVSGNAEIANSYRELLALARPDFEEELSRLVGDLPARGLSQFALKAAEWVRRARRTARENVAEYLQEESRVLVNKTELDEFIQGVDTLRETADRIDARIARLERRRKGFA